MIRFYAFGPFFLGTMSSVCVLWFEALRWLQSGHWPGWSLGGSLAPYIGDTSPFGAWLLDPQSWYGLHSVVLWLLKLPLPLWLFVSGLVLSSVFVKIEEEMVAAHKVKERKRRASDEEIQEKNRADAESVRSAIGSLILNGTSEDARTLLTFLNEVHQGCNQGKNAETGHDVGVAYHFCLEMVNRNAEAKFSQQFTALQNAWLRSATEAATGFQPSGRPD
jgi:hypothetical protein